RRGDEPGVPPRPRFAVAGRNRFELRVGVWQVANGATAATGQSIVSASIDNVFGGIGYTRYIREDPAATFSIDGGMVEASNSVGPNGISSGNVGGIAMPIGVRWNPFKGNLREQPFKPFITAAAGPVVAEASSSFVGGRTITSGVTTKVTLGGLVG